MLARLHQYKIYMFLCCVVLHKLSVCNFDSRKNPTCYMMCIKWWVLGTFPVIFHLLGGLFVACTYTGPVHCCNYWVGYWAKVAKCSNKLVTCKTCFSRDSGACPPENFEKWLLWDQFLCIFSSCTVLIFIIPQLHIVHISWTATARLNVAVCHY